MTEKYPIGIAGPDLNQTAVIHLVLEPADGISIRVDALPAIDLANLYEGMSGYDLNKP